MNRFSKLVEKILEAFFSDGLVLRDEFNQFMEENHNGYIIYQELKLSFHKAPRNISHNIVLSEPIPLYIRGNIRNIVMREDINAEALYIEIYRRLHRPLVFSTTSEVLYSDEKLNKILFFNSREEAELYYELNQ